MRFENDYLKNELITLNQNCIPKYEMVITDLHRQNEIFQNKINKLEDSNGWDNQSEKMLREMQKMQAAIDEVKHENEALRDEKHIFRNQLFTLKNVNESQQKLINFLNESKGNNYSNSPSFYQKVDLSIQNQHKNNFSPISEVDNELENTVGIKNYHTNENESQENEVDNESYYSGK